MLSFLETANALIWGIPTLTLITFTGLVLTIKTRFFQLRCLPNSFRYLFRSIRKKKTSSKTSAYGAMCTALGATVGTGNLAGVAGAIALGGPGAIFWMWVSGFLGMLVKFAEVVLAMLYREKDSCGNWVGGPMYVIRNGLPKKVHFLSYLYCFFGVVAIFGVGNTVQVNTLLCSTSAVLETFHISIPSILVGTVLSALCFHSFRGGCRRIVESTEKLIPFAAGIYILLSVYVLLLRFNRIPLAFSSIIKGAFHPAAVTGGMTGSFFLTMRIGTSRGVFTNEAGMGTASIAHAESDTNDPVKQGFLGIVEVFLDTIVICTLTALVILCSDIPIVYGKDPGILLTMEAFDHVLGNWCNILISILTCVLAYATILGWGLYGGRCAQFIFGNRIWKIYPFIQAAAVLMGTCLNTSAVWLVSELVNGLMAIPNLIAIVYLSPELFKTIRAYRF